MAPLQKDEEATAWVRYRGGVFKEVPLYYRGSQVFIPFRGGFIRLTARFDNAILTSNVNVRVLETSVLDNILDQYLKG